MLHSKLNYSGIIKYSSLVDTLTLYIIGKKLCHVGLLKITRESQPNFGTEEWLWFEKTLPIHIWNYAKIPNHVFIYIYI